MKINIAITGGQGARDKIAALANRLKDLRPAYLRAGIVVLRAGQARIDAGGPGWPPAKNPPKIGTLLHRTGALYRSLTLDGSDSVHEDLPNGIRVGTGLKTPDGRYSIGQLMQYGTRGFRSTKGRKSYDTGVFTEGGGIPARKFLFIDEPTARTVAAVFSSRVKGEL